MVVSIEQRLQEPPRVLVLPADEAAVIGLPILMGVIGREAIIGAIIGVGLLYAWKKLKGEGGLGGLLAAAYWFLPNSLGLYKGLPDSAVEMWEG